MLFAGLGNAVVDKSPLEATESWKYNGFSLAELCQPPIG